MKMEGVLQLIYYPSISFVELFMVEAFYKDFGMISNLPMLINL
jgi:hypothetical protein